MTPSPHRASKTSGFSLIEVVVGLLIFAMAAAIGFPYLTRDAIRLDEDVRATREAFKIRAQLNATRLGWRIDGLGIADVERRTEDATLSGVQLVTVTERLSGEQITFIEAQP